MCDLSVDYLTLKSRFDLTGMESRCVVCWWIYLLFLSQWGYVVRSAGGGGEGGRRAYVILGQIYFSAQLTRFIAELCPKFLLPYLARRHLGRMLQDNKERFCTIIKHQNHSYIPLIKGFLMCIYLFTSYIHILFLKILFDSFYRIIVLMLH